MMDLPRLTSVRLLCDTIHQMLIYRFFQRFPQLISRTAYLQWLCAAPQGTDANGRSVKPGKQNAQSVITPPPNP